MRERTRMTKLELEKENRKLIAAIEYLAAWAVEYADLTPQDVDDVYERYAAKIDDIGMENRDALIYMAMGEGA